MRKNGLCAAGVLALLLAAIACSKSSDSDIPDTSGSLQVFQMVPGNDLFDVVLDTTIIGSNLGYGDHTDGYRSFRAQKYSLWIYPAGNHATALLGGELNLRNGKQFSAFLTLDHANTLRLLVTEDDNAPSATGNARVRVVDLCDPYVRPEGSNNDRALPLDFYLDYKDSTSVPMFRAVTYGAVRSAEIIPRSYELDINWQDSSMVLQTVPLQVDSGRVYTLVATGDVLGDTFKMWQFENK